MDEHYAEFNVKLTEIERRKMGVARQNRNPFFHVQKCFYRFVMDLTVGGRFHMWAYKRLVKLYADRYGELVYWLMSDDFLCWTKEVA